MTAGVTGYFRFTDIFFEWHQALPNKEDIGPLKALISYDALVHPDHPLREQGVDGIEMYLGTFANGEMRLLMSSAQIEYMRYWLHAVGLTDSLIPLPASDWMIRPSELANCSPCVYREASVLKKAIKTIDKNNKKLKFAPSLLTNRRLNFERIRTFWAERVGTWCAMDFEAWERDHHVLTEFGWSLVRWEGNEDEQNEITEEGHLTIREHRGFFNGTYVDDNRDKFGFGESEEVDKKTFRKRILDLIETHRQAGPLFLIFHDNKQDIKYLRSDTIQALTEFEYLLPDQAPTSGIYIIDTAELFAALEGESGGNKRSLERGCRLLQLPTEYLHNAGNDAHYTMAVLRSMASGDPLDVQREKRWPNRTTSSNPKVEFKAWEEDSDMSDLEGVMPVDADAQPGNDDVTWNGFDM
ncbi:uncharacterized protein LAESUDRAFT_718741 [Laetiporus sulphureus 93-53]|uniref:Gfd2/YDR514C-like C-terminal domain-containing protein n=1 Tax=Laetiporus sulphureus 93-53 TaxID=1314785 RepID=A0A165I1S9_9APHY|nr:uncharacterized protein LAESUDRAFT_718741 [Laetiporus sulphureus 93-53]KZT12480.1 hypothetical protein LAESUDRAFT_718741 [Laetiporus sulphureus 93-53]